MQLNVDLFFVHETCKLSVVGNEKFHIVKRQLIISLILVKFRRKVLFSPFQSSCFCFCFRWEKIRLKRFRLTWTFQISIKSSNRKLFKTTRQKWANERFAWLKNYTRKSIFSILSPHEFVWAISRDEKSGMKIALWR